MTNPARNLWASAVRKILFLIAACGFGLVAHAQQTGLVTHLSGTLSVKRPDGTTKLLAVKSEVREGDLLTTEEETYARIKFADGGEVVMRPGSQLKIESYAYNQAKPESDNVVLSMLKGGRARSPGWSASATATRSTSPRLPPPSASAAPTSAPCFARAIAAAYRPPREFRRPTACTWTWPTAPSSCATRPASSR